MQTILTVIFFHGKLLLKRENLARVELEDREVEPNPLQGQSLLNRSRSLSIKDCE